VVCYQGAVVRAMSNGSGDPGGRGELLFEDGLAAAPALRALHLARENNWHFQGYRDDVLICEQDRPEAHLYARIAQCEITYVDDLAEVVRHGTVKAVVVIDDAEEVTRCQRLLTDELGASARVIRSLPPFVEITNPIAAKGRAVSRICDRLGITMAEVVAIGDAPNDIDLLAAAGFAVAVDGSRPEVLAVADALCLPPTQAGVADVLRELGLTVG
jgi:hydroxymethylpyrimidine pyrophosphatase-like HAD family hydrolase